jgi:hypothetical protein
MSPFFLLEKLYRNYSRVIIRGNSWIETYGSVLLEHPSYDLNFLKCLYSNFEEDTQEITIALKRLLCLPAVCRIL